VSDTPKLLDECKKLLDNGWAIVLYANPLGSYTAIAVGNKRESEIRLSKAVKRAVREIHEYQITDDFEPSQALTRLTNKVFGLRDGA